MLDYVKFLAASLKSYHRNFIQEEKRIIAAKKAAIEKNKEKEKNKPPDKNIPSWVLNGEKQPQITGIDS